jgi:hypothetical protein
MERYDKVLRLGQQHLSESAACMIVIIGNEVDTRHPVQPWRER